MEKTITMNVKEVQNNLLNVINGAQLPACVLELILSDILNEIKVISQKQYEMDVIKAYNVPQEDIDGGEQNDGRKISEEITEDSTEE